VPRDAINIASRAAQRCFDGSTIAVPTVRDAAYRWFQQDKGSATNGNELARSLLNSIRDDVIGQRRARAFLLAQDETRHPLIQQLIDDRILHVIKRGYSAQDEPGVRYDVLQIDYGCYVDLINTNNEPLGLLEVVGATGEPGFVEVPADDYRAIRRSILRLDAVLPSIGYAEDEEQ
jgi:hypothetical protein